MIVIDGTLTPSHKSFRYVLISWIGPKAPIICRVKTSGISASVCQCFGNVHVHLQVNSLELMSKERIIRELNRACGEHSAHDYFFTNETNETNETSLQNPNTDFEGDVTLDQLWEVFRQQESSINWILMQLEKNDSASIFGYGMNGMAEMIRNLDEREVLYGIFKVVAFSQAGARISIREKFVFLCWVPEEAPVFSRAQAVTRKQVLLKRLETYHVEIRAEQKEDISRENIVNILDNSCGSHKPQKYIFGPGDEMAC